MDIVFATDTSVFFKIGRHDHLFRLAINNQTQPEIDSLIDGRWSALHVVNADLWISQATAGEYSLRTLLAMKRAFQSGLGAAYSQSDLLKAAGLAADIVLHMLFVECLAGQYAELFTVESLPKNELRVRTKLLSCNFHDLIIKMGGVGLAQALKRHHRACECAGLTDTTALLEKMLAYLGKPLDGVVREPDASALDAIVKERVAKAVSAEYSKEYPHEAS